MRTFKLYRHGITMATSGTHKRRGGKRGNVTGWSPGAARRNVAFLRSIDERELTGHGYAITLTLRDCPLEHLIWLAFLTAWIKRQRRAGMIRLHWVMEFQSRGVPHLHVAIWYDNVEASKKALTDWIAITESCRSTIKGQHIRPIEGAVGWFMYLAKHCGRGQKHYQRQQNLLPAQWEKSPRVWGKSGDWPVEEVAEGKLTSNQFYRLRRLVRYQRVARARAAVPGPGWTWLSETMATKQFARSMPISPRIYGTVKTQLRTRLRHLQMARRMLSCTDEKLSPVRGISEWITQSEQAELFRAL